MKYFVLMCDGMADLPTVKLNGKTPMEAAVKPTMNMLAARSFCGLVKNVPEGTEPDNEAEILSVFGYDPAVYSFGRAAFETASLGIPLAQDQTAYCCSLVSLSEDEAYEDKILVDPLAGEISTEEAEDLLEAVSRGIATKTKTFYAGSGNRSCLVWKRSPGFYEFTDPEKITGRRIGDYLPSGPVGSKFLPYYAKSYNILKDHPVNKRRKERGLKPANSIWLWAPGKTPSLPDFNRIWNTDAAVISSSDLVRGVAICAGIRTVDVMGVTGNYDTDYSAKARAATEEFKNGTETVFVHVQAPNVCSILRDTDKKAASIEKTDTEILAPVYEYLCGCGEQFKMLVTSVHTVSSDTGLDTDALSPFFMYNSARVEIGYRPFTETNCVKGGFKLPYGHKMLTFFIRKPGVPGPYEPEKEENDPKEEKDG